MSELTADEIVDLCLRHTLYDWQQQGSTRPIAVASARGCEFFTVDGKRYLDFNSQLMGVNIGHADPRVAVAIAEQARVLPYISPFMATEVRAELGAKLAELMPGDLDKVFFTLGGAEANENAIRIAKATTGRQKILARYRSYHGATYATITLTGDPRRWANEPGMPGVVHVLDGYEARFLSPLKIEMLPGIDPALAARLRAAGAGRGDGTSVADRIDDLLRETGFGEDAWS